MKKLKVSLIVHDLSSNPIVRAYPFAQALIRLGYEVKVFGFLIKGESVYEPYRQKLNLEVVNISNNIFSYCRGLIKLIPKIDGDIIYCFKPRMPSFLPGLIVSKIIGDKPLLLDVEDDEIAFQFQNSFTKIFTLIFKGWLQIDSKRNLLLMTHLAYLADAVTVVSTKLKNRYGGVIVLHGPDEVVFNPSKYSRSQSRKQFNLPMNKIIIFFGGTPHQHKGIFELIEAIKALPSNYALVCAGPITNELYSLKNELEDKVILLGLLDYSDMPKLLTAVDIIPIVQHDTVFTQSQIPAKLLEAMAMEKIIVATPASDIQLILNKDKNYDQKGYIVSFYDHDELVNTLVKIGDDPQEATSMSKNARKYFLTEASVSALSIKLSNILDQTLSVHSYL